MHRKMAGVTETAPGVGRVEWESHGEGGCLLFQTQQREASRLSKARVGHTAAGWTEYSQGYHIVGTPHKRQKRKWVAGLDTRNRADYRHGYMGA